jgi:AhpC/TSA family
MRPALSALAALGLFLPLACSSRPDTSVGARAPEIAGRDLDGAPFKLSEYRGKVVLLDFWGDW